MVDEMKGVRSERGERGDVCRMRALVKACGKKEKLSDSLSSISHVLSSEPNSGINREYNAICGREELSERASSETRVARKIDEMERLSENDGWEL